MGVTEFPKSSACPVHLYDTKGFEPLSNNDDIVQAIRGVVNGCYKKALKHGFNTPGYHKERIHCVWWVVDNRVEEAMRDKLSQLFRESHVSIILVVNKCDRNSSEVDIVLSTARELVPDAADVLPFVSTPKQGPLRQLCPACGKDDIEISTKKGTFRCENKKCTECDKKQELAKSYGVPELMKATFKLLPDIIAASFHESQQLWLTGLRELAAARVKMYTGIAVAASWQPIPGGDAPILLANEVVMITNLANTFSLPVNITSVKQWAVSLLGMSGIAGGGYAFAQAFKLIPVVGTALGGFSSCVIAGSFTYALGELVTELFLRVRGAALHGEVTEETFKQLMGHEEQKAFLAAKMKEYTHRIPSEAKNE